MTLKQKRLVKNIGKARTITEAMINSGYAASTAHQQKSVLKRIGFEEGLEQYFPNEKVFQTHQDALNATRIHGTNDNFIEIPDYGIRLKAVELVYRAKGKLKDTGSLIGNLIFNVQLIRDERNRTIQTENSTV